MYYTFLEYDFETRKYAIMGFINKEKVYVLLGTKEPTEETTHSISEGLLAINLGYVK